MQVVTTGEQKQIEREAEILKRINHPNIVFYKDFLSECGYCAFFNATLYQQIKGTF